MVQRLREEAARKEMQAEIARNKGSVYARQGNAEIKVVETRDLIDEKKAEALERQKRLDQAVEGYSCRPQVEADPRRVL